MPPSETDAATSLLTRMRNATADLHIQAERSGVVAAILRGTITPPTYALYLRNLLPAYQALEDGLRHHANTPLLASLAEPALFRAASIQADLEYLTSAEPPPLLPAGTAYAARVALAASGDGALLIAHAYTRYLGDLSGGQILARRLKHLFEPDAEGLAFTRFPAIGDLRAFAAAFRGALEHAGSRLDDPAPIVAEAVVAFHMNIDVSLQVQRFAAAGGACSGK